MTRSDHRERPDPFREAALLYLAARLDAADAKKDMGDKKHGPYATIVSMCRNFGTEDENGSLTCTLDPPVTIDGITYSGFRLQAKQPAPYYDEDPAQAYIDSLPEDLQAAVTHTEKVYDFDNLYLLVQQGQIPAEHIDRLVITPPKEFSLTVLEAK